MNPTTSPVSKCLLIGVIAVFIISSLFMPTVFGQQLTNNSENSFVHTYINSPQGNYTYIEKPIFPVQINNSQIAIGQSWTIVCPLQENHSYHIYCFGGWINTSSQAKTDYDFYVYAPDGSLVSTHTESAGLPPHLGTTVDVPFFVPTQSGKYSFVMKNSILDSHGAQNATFMIIENLQTDQWYTSYIEGGEDSYTSLYRSWAYEFVTNVSHVELYVKVPETLDMYEARLYSMNNANSSKLNSTPLPWEPGLYGNVSGSVGGYNFNSTGYRGVAFASCEHNGQSMSLNYSSNMTGLKLYHLVLLGEIGYGNITLMLKTNFKNGTLIPINTTARVYPNDNAQIAFSSNSSTLEQAQLSYSTNNWTSINNISMIVSNQTCNATIPGYPAGSLIQYKINATDTMMNIWKASGNYTVKEPLKVNITAVKEKIRIGENITITGNLTPNHNDSAVEVQFSNVNSTQTIESLPSSNGTFVASFRPESIGPWAVSASSNETQTSFRCDSQELIITVMDQLFYVKYSLFIIAALIAVSVVGGVVYFIRFRKS
jgi:hypothetical protein